jgi:hypothetical protein
MSEHGPVITIFVRHSEDCKYSGDEFSKRCPCRKHLRWSHDGKQHRRKAGARSWAEAEKVKRDLEDQLAGRSPAKTVKPRTIAEGIDLFVQDKQIQGLTPDLIKKYELWLDRLRDYCEAPGFIPSKESPAKSSPAFAAIGPGDTRVHSRGRSYARDTKPSCGTAMRPSGSTGSPCGPPSRLKRRRRCHYVPRNMPGSSTRSSSL